MTIQFKCGQCGQTLKVGDNAAGKRAKCPKCQSVVSIPEVSAESPDLGPVPPPPPQPKPDSAGDEWDRFMDSPFPKDAENPYQSPTATKEPQYLPKGDPKTLGSQPVRNVPTEFGSIMNYSWAVWKENLGLLIGAMVVVMIIGGAVSGVSEVFFNIIAKTDLRRLIPVIALASMLVQTCVNTFLTVGLMQIILKLARRQRADFADLFGGGELFLPALGTNLLFTLATSIGFVLCIIPGIIVVLLWWPCVFLVVDRKANVMESFTMAREVTANNIGTIIVVWLAGIGISLVGLAACCVGIVAAAPLVAVMYGVSYLMMAGQIPANAQYRS
jgi:uncharacterized membrane protein/DNA-directed RNA polymerase subunit RPC12/RpoP